MSGAEVTGLDSIELRGVRAFGRHGVFEHEREHGQEFVVDAVLWLSLAEAAASDDVAHTVHYGLAAERIARIVEGEPVALIETLAERIAACLLGTSAAGDDGGASLDPGGRVQRVDVTVHKPQAPIEVPFGDVAVTVRRSRRRPEPGAESSAESSAEGEQS